MPIPATYPIDRQWWNNFFDDCSVDIESGYEASNCVEIAHRIGTSPIAIRARELAVIDNEDARVYLRLANMYEESRDIVIYEAVRTALESMVSPKAHKLQAQLVDALNSIGVSAGTRSGKKYLLRAITAYHNIMLLGADELFIGDRARVAGGGF